LNWLFHTKSERIDVRPKGPDFSGLKPILRDSCETKLIWRSDSTVLDLIFERLRILLWDSFQQNDVSKNGTGTSSASELASGQAKQNTQK